MGWNLQKVESAGDLTRFLKFPCSIYRDHPLWVPPLEFERRRFFDPKRNPFFKHAEADHFLVTDRDGNIAGRVSAIEDRNHNDFHEEKTGFFGMFECIDNQEVADLLIHTARNWCRERGLDTLRGPFNFSTNHECGLLVDCYDMAPVFGIPYNPPYYPSLIENAGLKKAKDLISMKVMISKVPDYMVTAEKRIMKRARFTIRSLRMGEFSKELDRVWDVYNGAWYKNWGFVPMSYEEFMFSAMEMKSFIKPDLCFIAEVNGEAAGFSLSLPDLNQVLMKMKGRLFPFGIFHFLLGKNKINVYRTLTLGVKPKFRRLGIDLVLVQRTYQWYVDHGIHFTDQSWVLEDNEAMLHPIERVGGEPYKRHRIYECPSLP